MSADHIEQLVAEGVVEVGRHTYGLVDVQWWPTAADHMPMLRVGAFCSIADDVRIVLNGDHRTEWVTTFPLTYLGPGGEPFVADPEHALHPRPTGPVEIGNDVWIGTRALVLGGTRIGDGAVIAAGAVVIDDVEPYTMVGGVPARQIRERFDAATVDRLRALRWWEWPDDVIRTAAGLLMAPPDDATLTELEGVRAAIC